MMRKLRKQEKARAPAAHLESLGAQLAINPIM